jgi:3-deoxy-manno-octulosonate cytidylyltransferase (CMP-KDO synthetase)
MQKSIGIIPARYASSRFPGKPLVSIGEKTMIQRVYEQCIQSDLDEVCVATDHEAIAEAVRKFGGQVVMTSADIPSGTDRCREALNLIGDDSAYVLNIQGDEPFIDPGQINQLLSILKDSQAEIATLITPAIDQDEIDNPNRVKVVRAVDGKALYFSRSVVPYPRNSEGIKPSDYFIHLGIYGFTRMALIKTGLLHASALEIREGLEQLRWLENGMSVVTGLTEIRGDAVDTPEDLESIRKKYLL